MYKEAGVLQLLTPTILGAHSTTKDVILVFGVLMSPLYPYSGYPHTQPFKNSSLGPASLHRHKKHDSTKV